MLVSHQCSVHMPFVVCSCNPQCVRCCVGLGDITSEMIDIDSHSQLHHCKIYNVEHVFTRDRVKNCRTR